MILTLLDLSFLTYSDTFSKAFRFYYTFLIPINIRKATKIITISKASKKEIETYFPDAIGKIEVIYPGLNPIFKLDNTIQKKNQILYVGSINKRKNFISVLKTFMYLDIDYKLIMVGNFSNNFTLDEISKKLIKKAKQSDKIEFRENVSDEELIKLYNLAKLFIYPSFYEGFGLPVAEAMACGTPVITSNVSSLPEVGGDAVVYVDPNNIEDIKEKIIMILNDEDLQKQMIENGLKRAKEFTWEKSAKKHMEVFQKVLK